MKKLESFHALKLSPGPMPCDEVCPPHLLSLLLSLSNLSCQGVGYNIISRPSLFPGGSDGKESACSAGDLGSIPGMGRALGEVNDRPLQDSCLENPMDRGAWWATVHGGHKESDMTE